MPRQARVSTADNKWAVNLVKLGDCKLGNPAYKRVPVLLHRSATGGWSVYHLLFTVTTAQFACEVGVLVAHDLRFRSCP